MSFVMIDRTVGALHVRYPERFTQEWTAWRNMNAICGKKYYEETKVFNDWKRIKGDLHGNRDRYNNFLTFIGRKPNNNMVLSRIDKSGDFVPGNVKWATQKELQQNKGSYKKFSYARDEELIQELTKRGYVVNSNNDRARRPSA